MTIPNRLSIVTIGVADLDRSSAFYEALGWTRATSSVDEIRWYDIGGVWLGVFGRDELAADAGVPAEGSGFAGITLAINVGSHEAVDTALETAVAAGGALVLPARSTDFGGYGGYFADPDGHLWEVMDNPMFPVDEDGRVHIA